MDLIRTVFNYSANFNVIEETGRKQPVSPKQFAKQGEYFFRMGHGGYYGLFGVQPEVRYMDL